MSFHHSTQGPTDCSCEWDDSCYAGGKGLRTSVRGQKANFDIFFKNPSEISLGIEIRGPLNTVCYEKIEPASGKRTGISTKGPFQLGGPKLDQRHIETHIPLWYQVLSHKVSTYYIPLVVGTHKIRILNHGLPLRGCPFAAHVYERPKRSSDLSQLTVVTQSIPRVVSLIENRSLSRLIEKTDRNERIIGAAHNTGPSVSSEKDLYDLSPLVGPKKLTSGHSFSNVKGKTTNGQESKETSNSSVKELIKHWNNLAVNSSLQ